MSRRTGRSLPISSSRISVPLRGPLACLTALALIALLGAPVAGAVNQTPKKKNAIIWGPNPSAQDVDNLIQARLCAENYAVTKYVWGRPGFDPTVKRLKGIAAAGFAVLVLIGHAGFEKLCVEDFAVADSALAQLDRYSKDPDLESIKDDLEVSECTDVHPKLGKVRRSGIWITAAGLKKLFGGTDEHSIIAVLTCQSWELHTSNDLPFGPAEFLGFKGTVGTRKRYLAANDVFQIMGGLRGIDKRPVDPAYFGLMEHVGLGNTTLAPACKSHEPTGSIPIDVVTQGKTIYETEMKTTNPAIMVATGCEATLADQQWQSNVEHRFTIKPTKPGRLEFKVTPTIAVSKNNDNWLVGNRYDPLKDIDDRRKAVEQCPYGTPGLDGADPCPLPIPENPYRWCVWCVESPPTPGQPDQPSKPPEKMQDPNPAPRMVPWGDRESFVLYQDAADSNTVLQASGVPTNMSFQQVGSWFGHLVFTPAANQVGQQYSVSFQSSDIHGPRDQRQIVWQVVPRDSRLSLTLADSSSDLGEYIVRPSGPAEFTFLVANTGNTFLTGITLDSLVFTGPGPLSTSGATFVPNSISVLSPGEAVPVVSTVPIPWAQAAGAYSGRLYAAAHAAAATVSAQATLLVHVNRPPTVLAHTDTIRVQAGEPVVVPLTLRDPDADTLSAFLECVPVGAELQTILGQVSFRWTPPEDAIGVHIASVLADDGLEGTVQNLVFDVVPRPEAPPRQDVIWARDIYPGVITLDGHLDEPAWAVAESTDVEWMVDSGIPGSGWQTEGGLAPIDPLHATLKFLRRGNQLYMAAIVRDHSVGGSDQFNRFDGMLMAIQDHRGTTRPTPPMEHFYSWWWPGDPNPNAIGKMPSFIGAWGNYPPLVTRTPQQVANWDAVTAVSGVVNSDSFADNGYTTEMRFDVAADGYDFMQSTGDAVEFNISIYDCDWYWPLNSAFSSNRTWWQGPWGNVSWYHEARIQGRSDVTMASGTVPVVAPDVIIPDGSDYPAPTLDGTLTDQVWQHAQSFDVRWGDDALRAGYPGVGRYRSGQFQPVVNGGHATVVDPADATVHWFFQGDRLYLGFDVRDHVVQHRPEFDRYDGFLVSIDDRVARGPDQNLSAHRLTFQVGPNGQALASDDLPHLRDDLNGAGLALHLKPGTTVDTLGIDTDQGYTAELWVDLTKLGYPPGRGDGIVFLGITLLDGDSYGQSTNSYGTRTWWFREFDGFACAAWAYLEPAPPVLEVQRPPHGTAELALLGNEPNPFVSRTTIRFLLDTPGKVFLDVFDVQGRQVEMERLGLRSAGEHRVAFNRGRLGSGLYFFRLRIQDPTTGGFRTTRPAKAMILR